MQQVYVVHYHEIALKGRNRPMFLKCLQENICRTTGLTKNEVKIVSGRLIVTTQNSSLPAERSNLAGEIATLPLVARDDIELSLSRVFGVSSFSPAVLVRAEYMEIERTINSVISNEVRNLTITTGQGVRSLGTARDDKILWNTFAIATTRGDKTFPMTSMEVNIKLGAFVNEEFGKKVDLTNPDVTFYVEIFQTGALIYIQRHPGPGGLPLGTQSKVAVMLSGGIDSPVAAYRIMKRGAPIVAVHCHSYPFTSRSSIDKVKELAGILSQYGGSMKLYLVPLADAQKAVVQNCDQKYRVLLYRRLMVRIAENIARKENAQMLVTGESLGQVASQTVENICVTDAAATMPILRPLIGYDKEEIIAEAKQIGTYEVSILPHDDCCTIMMPKNPAIRARLEDVEREEAKLDVSRLVENAIVSTEQILIK